MDDLAHCDECHGPVQPMTIGQLLWGRLAYRVWMTLPTRMALSKLGYWLLPYAGRRAHTCSCFGKCRSARALAGEKR